MSHFLNHPAVHAIGWALLHFIWQGALLATLVLIANALTAQSQAKLRYAIACIAMLLMPVLFVATIFRTSTSSPTGPGPTAAATTSIAGDPGAILTAPAAPIAAIPTSYPRNSDLLTGWAVLLWIAGVAALAIYTFVGWGRTRRLTRQGVQPPTPALAAMLENLQQRLSISPPIKLCVSAIAEVPAVIGWLRPYILLPVSAITGLSESELRAILAHELAHIRRHDYLINLLQNAIETLLFYHPAVWWVSSRIRQEREHCCDDIAVAVCGDAMAYASALTQLEELRGSIGEPALAATGGDLLGRIRRLAGMDDTRQSRIHGAIGSFAVAALVVAIAIVSVNSALHAKSTHKPLEFEVASIKPDDPNVRMMVGGKIYPGGRVVLPRMSLKGLVKVAFGLSYWQISGGEAWMEKQDYDIEALPPQDLQPPITNLRYSLWAIDDERLREMLQSMLIDRFHLQFHRETKTGKVYLLERNSKTLKLQPNDPALSRNADASPGFSGDIGFAGGRWVLSNTSIPQLAKRAERYVLGTPVFDKTGLNGYFDYKQPTSLPDSEVDHSNPPFIPLLSEVGLKLTPSHGPIETFVIDRAEKPSEN